MNSALLSSAICDPRVYESEAADDVPEVVLGKTANRNPALVEAGVADAISEVEVWGEHSEGSDQLLRHWAKGGEGADLFTFHPGLEQKLRVRRAVLERHVQEQEAVARNRARATLNRLLPPVSPEEPVTPRLWHLSLWADIVQLPWNWECEGASEFREKWQQNVGTEGFKGQLAHLVYWWMAKKVSPGTTFPALILFVTPLL